MALELKLNDEQESILFTHFEYIYLNNETPDDDLKMFDFLDSIGLKHFIKILLSSLDQEEECRYIFMIIQRYDL